jgi:flagellar M-ring protein FliF
VAEVKKTGAGAGLAGVSTQAGVLERVGAIAGDVRGRVEAMPPARRKWLATAAVMVAAIVAGMLWYADRPDWRVLFSGLDAKDTQQIAQELSAAGIVYELTEDGSGIQVGADQVDKARMEVASKGMPQSGRMGFELFDKPNWVGSEFDEKVNYQRALEGELEHTIGTLAVVRTARVHIVMPKDSLFGDGEKAAKASVVLQLRRPVMPQEQAESIRSLVAGAVENLSPGDVTLVDADGRLNLNSPSTLGGGAAAGDAEKALEEKLVAMLEPTAGLDNVRAVVNVSYDEGSEEKTDEVYDPTLVAATSLHKSSQVAESAMRTAGGVPGTASNTPGAAANGSVQAAVGGGTGAAATAAAAKAGGVPPLLQTSASASGGVAQGAGAALPVYPQGGLQGGGETVTDESGTYAVTRHLTHSEEGPGRVKRVTVAVLVNDRLTTDGVGKLEHTVWKPRSADEMKRLEELARAAVGFDATRGDQVVLENVSFSSNAPEVKAPAMEKLMDQTTSVLHTQPGLLKTLSFSLLSLVVLLMVVRPVTKQLLAVLSPPAALGGGGAGSQALSVGEQAAARLEHGSRPSGAQEIFEHVSEHIRKEPSQSTRLLESWIGQTVEESE